MGAITVSVIAPTAYLRDFVDQVPPTLHHITAQRVLHDNLYRRFYREQVERGASLVLDNGVFDIGQSLAPDDLLNAARQVRAAEVVLPDVIHDGPATITASEAAARVLHRRGDSLRLCAVVQGGSDHDWLACYSHFLTAPYVGALALPSPKIRSRKTAIYADRLVATSYLDSEEMVSPRLIYRLLGLGDSGHHELSQQRRFAWIQSADSSAPVVLGAMGIRILAEETYQKLTTSVEELGPIARSRLGLIRENIATVRAAAGCVLRLPS